MSSEFEYIHMQNTHPVKWQKFYISQYNFDIKRVYVDISGASPLQKCVFKQIMKLVSYLFYYTIGKCVHFSQYLQNVFLNC